MPYKVEVTGQYIGRSVHAPDEKTTKEYKIAVVVPEAVNVLSVIKNKILDAKLRSAYPDYVTFRTHHILSISPMDEKSKATLGEIPAEYMDRASLLHLIKLHKLSVDARYYPDLFKLRQAVKFALEDPAGYQKHFEAKRNDILLDLQIAKLNPELQHSQVATDVPEPPPAPTIPLPKATKDPEALAAKTENRFKGLNAAAEKESLEDLLGPVPDAPTPAHTPGIEDI